MLSVELAGMKLESPILNASGCFNPGLFNRLHPLKGQLGAVVTKTVTAMPAAGNMQQRTVELPGVGMLNSIGLQNPGLDALIQKELPELKPLGVPVIVSLAARSIEEYGEMVARLEGADNVCAYEINLSCPNVAKGGVDFGVNPDTVRKAVASARDHTRRPVLAKLTPNVQSIVPLAEAAAEGGADGITAINTLLGTAIDIRRKKAYLPRISGGYSGPGIKPVALHHVWQIHRHLPELPIVGVGGITCAEDVVEFLMAGATAVQVGTGCFRTPGIFQRIVDDLLQYVEKEGIKELGVLTGAAHGGTIVTTR